MIYLYLCVMMVFNKYTQYGSLIWKISGLPG